MSTYEAIFAPELARQTFPEPSISLLSAGLSILYVGVRSSSFKTQVFLKSNLSNYSKVYTNFLLNSYSLTCRARLAARGPWPKLVTPFLTIPFLYCVPYLVFSFQPLNFVHAISSYKILFPAPHCYMNVFHH